MNRKQHIENLNTLFCSQRTDLRRGNLSLQYAIDHLSREWVSRKRHRQTIKKDRELSFNKQLFFIAKADDLKALLDKKCKEIDEIKADKDRLKTTLDKKFEEAELWKENSIKLESDWEKESDKVCELETQRIWLYITSVALFITLLISLFTR